MHICRLHLDLDRAVHFRVRPQWTRYYQGDWAMRDDYDLEWSGELSWLGMVLSVDWHKA